MKRNIPLIPLLFLATWTTQATNLKIEPLLGAEQQYAVAQIGKITFADEVMYLFDQSGEQLGSTPLSQIGKILFDEDGQENPTSLEDAKLETIQVFPNPTQEWLVIRGLDGLQTIRIYSVQGQLMQSTVTNNGQAYIPVGSLQNGTYLVQVGAQVVKFIKE